MDKLSEFWQAVQEEQTLTLATADADSVSMRTVSPVAYQGRVLMFTDRASRKYRQLAANPRCCLAVRGFFAEATAQLCGPTMNEENRALRAAYCEKFSDAFDENVPFGGRAADFVLLQPTLLRGWTSSAGQGGLPDTPFELKLG